LNVHVRVAQFVHKAVDSAGRGLLCTSANAASVGNRNQHAVLERGVVVSVANRIAFPLIQLSPIVYKCQSDIPTNQFVYLRKRKSRDRSSGNKVGEMFRVIASLVSWTFQLIQLALVLRTQLNDLDQILGKDVA
jgi:hypothetical protein